MWFNVPISIILGVGVGVILTGSYVIWLLMLTNSVNKGEYKKNRKIILSLASTVIILGMTSLILFIIARMTDQPYHVWYPFMMLGSSGGIWTACILLIHKLMKKRIIKSEVNMMNVDDLT